MEENHGTVEEDVPHDEGISSAHPSPKGSAHPSPKGSAHPSPQGSSHLSPKGSAHPSPQGSSHLSPQVSSRQVSKGSVHPSRQGSSQLSPKGSAHPSPQGSVHLSPKGSAHPTPKGSDHRSPQGSSQPSRQGSAQLTAQESAHSVRSSRSARSSLQGSAEEVQDDFKTPPKIEIITVDHVTAKISEIIREPYGLIDTEIEIGEFPDEDLIDVVEDDDEEFLDDESDFKKLEEFIQDESAIEEYFLIKPDPSGSQLSISAFDSIGERLLKPCPEDDAIDNINEEELTRNPLRLEGEFGDDDIRWLERVSQQIEDKLVFEEIPEEPEALWEYCKQRLPTEILTENEAVRNKYVCERLDTIGQFHSTLDTELNAITKAVNDAFSITQLAREDDNEIIEGEGQPDEIKDFGDDGLVPRKEQKHEEEEEEEGSDEEEEDEESEDKKKGKGKKGKDDKKGDKAGKDDKKGKGGKKKKGKKEEEEVAEVKRGISAELVSLGDEDEDEEEEEEKEAGEKAEGEEEEEEEEAGGEEAGEGGEGEGEGEGEEEEGAEGKDEEEGEEKGDEIDQEQEGGADDEVKSEGEEDDEGKKVEETDEGKEGEGEEGEGGEGEAAEGEGGEVEGEEGEGEGGGGEGEGGEGKGGEEGEGETEKEESPAGEGDEMKADISEDEGEDQEKKSASQQEARESATEELESTAKEPPEEAQLEKGGSEEDISEGPSRGSLEEPEEQEPGVEGVEQEEEPVELQPVEREIYAEKYKGLVTEKYVLRRRNMILQRKCVEHFKKRKLDSAYKEIEVTPELEQKYFKKLLAFEETRNLDENERLAVTKELQEMKEEKLRMREELENKLNELIQKERQVGSGLINTKTGKVLPEKVLQRFLSRQRNKVEEVGGVRLKYIKLRDRVAEKEAALHALETLGEGLHLIDYEQLRMENQNYSDKIEERDEELERLRGKATSAIQILAHVREKANAIVGDKDDVVDRLAQLEIQVNTVRKHVNKLKRRRDYYREETLRLRKEAGLLAHPRLLRDFEDSIEECSQVAEHLNCLKTSFYEQRRQLTQVRDLIKKYSGGVPEGDQILTAKSSIEKVLNQQILNKSI